MAPDDAGRLPPDAARFLGAHTRAFLLTLRRDGSPTIHPMTGFPGDGGVVFNTYRKSVKARNVIRDARSTAVVVNGYGDGPAQALVVKGRAAVRETAGAMPAATAGAPKVAHSIAGRVTERLAAGKRVLVVLEPEETEFVAP